MTKQELIFGLKRFNDDSGAGEGSDDNKDAGTDKGTADKDADGGGQQSATKSQTEKPFATFPDKESFMARVEREGSKQFKAYAKELGYENPDDLKADIQSYKEAQEANESEKSKLEKRSQKLEEKLTQAEKRANETLLNSEAKMKAFELDVDPKRVNYLLKMADLSEIEVKDGQVDSSHLEEVLNGVLEDIPELKKQKDNYDKSPSGSESFKDKDDKTDVTMASLKGMSTKEVQKYMEENPEAFQRLMEG